MLNTVEDRVRKSLDNPAPNPRGGIDASPDGIDSDFIDRGLNGDDKSSGYLD
jgi:hypothetical protein